MFYFLTAVKMELQAALEKERYLPPPLRICEVCGTFIPHQMPASHQESKVSVQQIDRDKCTKIKKVHMAYAKIRDTYKELKEKQVQQSQY